MAPVTGLKEYVALGCGRQTPDTRDERNRKRGSVGRCSHGEGGGKGRHQELRGAVSGREHRKYPHPSFLFPHLAVVVDEQAHGGEEAKAHRAALLLRAAQRERGTG